MFWPHLYRYKLERIWASWWLDSGCLFCLGIHLAVSFDVREDRFLSSLEACVKVISLSFFFSKSQAILCSLSFQLFFNREGGQKFLRRGRYSGSEGPKHRYRQYRTLKPFIPSILPHLHKTSLHLLAICNMQSPTWFFSSQILVVHLFSEIIRSISMWKLCSVLLFL